MSSSSSHRALTTAALTITALLLAACDSADVDESSESADLTALRTAVEPLRDLTRARQAGYATAITPCWYHRTNGGQGVHYARTELIDGTVSLLQPEIVMYEPMAEGRLEATAVEYIVPFDRWTRAEAPTVLGQHLHRNEGLGLWVLHVWLWRENPSGLYADWNPNVSCANASESEERP
jgi:hypothetical protein